MLNTDTGNQLNAVFTDSLHQLERRLLERHTAIEAWFQDQWQQTEPPVYGSVDLRNAGFKLAPIDMNLFPAGFNNLNPNFLSLSQQAAKQSILRLTPSAKKILIIPEAHTRNLFYWANMQTLQHILQAAGFDVRLASLDLTVKSNQQIQLEDGTILTVEPLVRKEEALMVADFVPDVVLLNNDLSEGIPDILLNIKQPLLPPAELGWSQRLKSGHFQHYQDVAREFADFMQTDAWLLAPLFRHCGPVDFMAQEGMACLIKHGSDLFAEIEKKYAEYHINEAPFLIVKADAGTYGMAVMTVRNIDELKSMNRKQRTRMSVTKGGQPVHSVIIQEGVHTFETVGEAHAVAEPVVYLFGSEVVGGFYRIHKERGVDENLNAPGMEFQPLPFSEVCNTPSADMGSDACCNRFFVYGIVARLSMLAAAREMKDK